MSGSALMTYVCVPSSLLDITSSFHFGWVSMVRPQRMMMPTSSVRLITLDGKHIDHNSLGGEGLT